MSIFLNIPESEKLYMGKYLFLIKDRFPVSDGHILIITNELRKDYFDLSIAELLELNEMISKAKEIIESEYNPDGYNIGMNIGEAAGQTIFHFHCHVIPRYTGDMEDPRGGVRHCISGKGYY